MKSTYTGREFSAAEQKIADVGFPPFLILNAAERKAAWDRSPPKAAAPWVDPRVEQDRSMREQQKKDATQKRIDALRKSKGLDPSYSATQPQENVMPKYVIKPLDKHGHPIMRAVTSVDDSADDAQINEKVLKAAERGGSKVVNILLVNTLSEVVLAWGVVDGVVAPCDVEPFKSTPQHAPADAEPAGATQTQPAGETVEGQMAKTKRTPKPKAEKKPKGDSKTGVVAKLLQRANGCTTKEVLEATGWPAVSMPAIAKAAKLKLRKEKEKGKPTRYYGS